MKSLLGWAIIVTGLGLISALILSPWYVRVRRRRQSGADLLAYLFACGLCGTAIWYALPWLVHALHGRATP